MKRRQFLQTLAATAGSSLIPAPLLAQARVSPAVYAKAISYAASDACFAPSHLLSTLGVEGQMGDAVISQLKLDGLISEMGNTGLMYSKTVYNKQAKIAAKALHDAYAANSGEKPADLIKRAQDKVKELGEQASDFIDDVTDLANEDLETDQLDETVLDEQPAILETE